jgi:hypothetical protein
LPVVMGGRDLGDVHRNESRRARAGVIWLTLSSARRERRRLKASVRRTDR